MNRKSLTLVAALVGMSLLVSGCAVALVAGAAGGAGGYAWASGKLSFSTDHNIDECHNATISALSELRIKVTGDTTDKLIGRVKGVTATNKEVTIDLEPQSIHVTKIDIRVGFWGNETQSTMIADAIKRHLS